MPKMKTSSAAKKRFRLSAAGKVLRRRAKRKDTGIASVDTREALRLLGKR